MGENARRGHTGQTVQESGTYRCESGETWSYQRGDRFRECPKLGKSTIWEKSGETEHPGGSR